MIVYYKIVEVWPENQTITVRYYTSEVTEDDLKSGDQVKEDGTPVRCRTDLSISIPHPRPTDSELRDTIKRNAPIPFLEMQEKIKNKLIDTSMKKYENMMGIMNYFDTNEGAVPVNPEIKKLIDSI